MEGGDLLAEGGYGCIFYPSINCRGKETQEIKYISKIQHDDSSSQNEIFIGSIIIKNIPNYNLFFAPAQSHCNITARKLDFTDMHKCSVINKKTKKKLINLKMPYTHGKEIGNFIIKNKNVKLIITNIIHSYQHLLHSIQKLQKINICHFDIKTHNIIFDTNRNIPILIDFGLSILISKNIHRNMKKLQLYFYRYVPQYYIWPLEVHILNYLLHIKKNNELLNTSDINDIVQQFIDNNKILKKNFSKTTINLYKKLCLSFARKFIQLPKNKCIERILSYWKTWDNYGLSICFFKILKFINPKGFQKNPFIIHFSQLLFQNIHPVPSKRFDIETTLSKFNAFFYNPTINRISNYENLFTQLDNSYLNIKNAIFQNMKEMKTLISLSSR